MATIFINGKFFSQPTTGVQRFAAELVIGLDALLDSCQAVNLNKFVLLVPKGVGKVVPHFKYIQVVELAGFRSHLWEQVALPFFVGNCFLVNLSGSAPLLKRNQTLTIHDAAIFDFPEAYSKKFVAWYRLQFWLQSKRAVGLLTVSEFSRGRLSRNLGVIGSRFCVIHNGADHIFRIGSDARILTDFGLASDGYLLAVGSANPSKNFAALIEAFSSMKVNDKISLVVVGGANSAVFADQALAEDPRIVRTGRIDDAQLKALYCNARAFVFPSLYEGFGIPPLEAMACGCPVVASNAASIPEVCGNAAGYFDPTSVSSIRLALQKIIDDEHWRSELQTAGTEKAKEYTWAAAAEQLLAHLKKIGAISD